MSSLATQPLGDTNFGWRFLIQATLARPGIPFCSTRAAA